MKRHEFEQECLQMILDKKPEDFLEEFEYGDMKEFLADFLVSYAEYRNQPVPLVEFVLGHVVWVQIDLAHAILLRKLLCQHTFLGFSGWVRADSFHAEKVHQLVWDFLQRFLGQHHRVIHELSERDELNNVCSHVSF